MWTTPLTKEQFVAFSAFVQECKDQKLSIGLCSTEEIYQIQTGDQTFVLRDGNCTWHGFNKLKATLFVSDNK